jgi:hypothetical protein
VCGIVLGLYSSSLLMQSMPMQDPEKVKKRKKHIATDMVVEILGYDPLGRPFSFGLSMWIWRGIQHTST